MELELKRISPDGIAAALEKAERYRLLNDPAQAESIYRDVLAVDPDNQVALRALILALTDQFGAHGAAGAAHEAREHVAQLDDEYDRAYYTGIVIERETRAYLERKNVVRSAAYDGFRHAMEWYERAEALHPGARGTDAVLRWNSCVRAIAREQLEAHVEGEPELPLE
jgi:tetratricopeptide (TPR) repeat protein